MVSCSLRYSLLGIDGGCVIKEIVLVVTVYGQRVSVTPGSQR